MSVTGSVFFDELCQRGSIREADVQKLRQLYYEDGIIAGAEADALFEIHHACQVKDPAWQDFFIEAVSDYIVGHAEPRGYINAENADWLIERITHDGAVEQQTELEIAISVIDKARWAPESLVRFTLNAVKDAVISGDGRLRNGNNLSAGVVTDGDVELLRRILYAFGGDAHIAVSRAEAEVLFEINDATAENTDNPAWTEFFVKAVASVVMTASGYQAPSRSEALARELWLDARGDLSPGSFIGEMTKTRLSHFADFFRPCNSQELELARLERERREILTNEEITGDEAIWVAAQIKRDGELTYNERCLIEFLRAESPKLAPELASLIEEPADRV